MRVFKFFLLIFVVSFSAVCVFAEEEVEGLEEVDIPRGMELIRLDDGYYEIIRKDMASPRSSGMEVKKVGGTRIRVPKGIKIIKKGKMIMIEGKSEYMSRRFLEIEELFSQYEAKQKKLEETIGKLEKTIEELKESSPKEDKLANSRDIIVAE
ncbi:MAG: hypothetical protein ABIH08_00210 [Candidatus Omnitrophota bacterium]